jgi:hypothetical protein
MTNSNVRIQANAMVSNLGFSNQVEAFSNMSLIDRNGMLVQRVPISQFKNFPNLPIGVTLSTLND